MNPIKAFLPRGRKPRTVLGGLLRGIKLHIDLHCELMIYAGLYEQETFADIRRLARGCRGFIDLGAGKGELAILFLRDADIGRVVAVEPSPSERRILASNMALNGLAGDARLEVREELAGEEPGCVTLEQLLSGVPSPTFIKIDIEGPEAEVIASGRASLDARDCRLLIETHSMEAETSCIAQLEAAGYRTQVITPAWWRIALPEQRGNIPHNRWLAAWRAEALA